MATYETPWEPDPWRLGTEDQRHQRLGLRPVQFVGRFVVVILFLTILTRGQWCEVPQCGTHHAGTKEKY